MQNLHYHQQTNSSPSLNILNFLVHPRREIFNWRLGIFFLDFVTFSFILKSEKNWFFFASKKFRWLEEKCTKVWISIKNFAPINQSFSQSSSDLAWITNFKVRVSKKRHLPFQRCTKQNRNLYLKCFKKRSFW